MTKLETSLLDILQEDCRTPLEKMAVMTGSTLEEVADAIGKLEERKIILRYTLKELAAFVSGKLSPLETVTGTATSFVLKRYKEEGVIFENDDTDRRLVISP